MITRKSLKEDIDHLKSLVVQLSLSVDNSEQARIDNHVAHVDLSRFVERLNSSLRSFESKLSDIESKLYMLECQIAFLDHNRDAIEMWIECVRQTQQLYKESQKPVDTCED